MDADTNFVGCVLVITERILKEVQVRDFARTIMMYKRLKLGNNKLNLRSMRNLNLSDLLFIVTDICNIFRLPTNLV